MESVVRISGQITAIVYDRYNIEKSRSVSHNIVTSSGDSLIVDGLQNTPVRQKINNANGYIVVGTGWTGISPKTNTWVNVQTGVANALDSGFPSVLAPWGSSAQPAANSNVLRFQTTFLAGSLNVNGINEAAIVSATAAGSSVNCLAYGQIIPTTNVTATDTLVIVWAITFVGS